MKYDYQLRAYNERCKPVVYYIKYNRLPSSFFKNFWNIYRLCSMSCLPRVFLNHRHTFSLHVRLCKSHKRWFVFTTRKVLTLEDNVSINLLKRRCQFFSLSLSHSRSHTFIPKNFLRVRKVHKYHFVYSHTHLKFIIAQRSSILAFFLC